MRMRIDPVWGALVLVAACATSTRLHEPAPSFEAPVLAGALAEGRTCIPDINGALSGLARSGRPIAIDLGDAPGLGRFTNHAQGVVRLPRSPGTLVVSRSGAGLGALVADVPELGEAENDGAGEAAVVATIASPPDADHGGGIDVLDDLLFVPFEDRNERALVAIYDLAEPSDPRLVHEVDRTEGPFPHPGNSASATAARLADGRILLIVGAHSSRSLDFYVSNGPEPGAPGFAMHYFASLQRHVPTGIQTTTLLTQCDGTLFLVGAWNTRLPPPSGGQDLLGWFRLDLDASGAPRLTETGRAHFDCWKCNFAAGAGVFVSDDGDVRLYAVAHDDLDGDVIVEEFVPAR